MGCRVQPTHPLSKGRCLPQRRREYAGWYFGRAHGLQLSGGKLSRPRVDGVPQDDRKASACGHVFETSESPVDFSATSLGATRRLLPRAHSTQKPTAGGGGGRVCGPDTLSLPPSQSNNNNNPHTPECPLQRRQGEAAPPLRHVTAGVRGGTPRGISSACEQRDDGATLTDQKYFSPVARAPYTPPKAACPLLPRTSLPAMGTFSLSLVMWMRVTIMLTC